MTWLLKLYPPRWRQRYGEEFAALIASQRFSFFTVLDIIGGAIDAWTRPQSHLAPRTAPQSQGETIMLAKLMRLRCACHGPQPTTADAVKGAGVVIGGSALSVLAATWMQRQSVDPVFTDTLMQGGWLIAFVLSLPFTTLKGWPARIQVIFIGILLTVVVALVFGGVWINRG
jgi:hypothetical protein